MSLFKVEQREFLLGVFSLIFAVFREGLSRENLPCCREGMVG